MMWSRRSFSLGLTALASVSSAQTTYPNRILRFIVPISPGSATDVIVRVVAERLQATEKIQSIVENKAGGGTTIASAFVAQSDPDGHTILANSTALTTAPYLFRKLSYDPIKDFVGVAPLASIPNLLLVSAQSRWHTVRDLVNAGREAKRAMAFASAGYGTGTHLNGEKFRVAARMDGLHVPYKGTPEAIAAVAAGDVEWFFAPGASAVGAIKAGRVRALAVGSPRRSAAWPNLPTTEESGVAGSGYEFWTALFAPSHTPMAVVGNLNRSVNAVLRQIEVRERFATLGAEVFPMEVDAFQTFMRQEQESTAKLVKAAGIQPVE